jgi:hypothetical protein
MDSQFIEHGIASNRILLVKDRLTAGGHREPKYCGFPMNVQWAIRIVKSKQFGSEGSRSSEIANGFRRFMI